MNQTDNNLKLAFTCVQEKDNLPPLDPQADIWFKQARVLEKADGAKDFSTIGSLYRQAVAKDHYKAMRNLQNLLIQGLVTPLAGKTWSEEAVEIVERMIKLNIPAGYYAMGYYLENGYGVEPDKNASLAYFRKAADLGNPEGQNVIGRIFLRQRGYNGQANQSYNPEIGIAMLNCASNQGLSDAAINLASYYKIAKKDYSLAIKYYQLAVRHGSALASRKLEKSFNGPISTDELNFLGLNKDQERSLRYGVIFKEIENNPSARFPDIDKIVPLPPAPLPKWDGTFEYKKQPAQ